MKSILLVGEYGDEPRMALWPYPEHTSGGRLARILGLEVRDYLLLNDRTNLCRESWDRTEAAEAVQYILETRPKNSGLVMLGRKVEDVFGWVYRRYEVRYIQPGFHALALPHPNGCREWSDIRNISLARAAYEELRRAVGLTLSTRREGEPSDV